MKVAALFLLCLAVPAFAGEKPAEHRKPSSSFKVHPCENDALAAADKLLRLHFSGDSNAKDIENLSIDDHVTKVAPIKAPVGKGKFDVLEVNGYIYKGNYRMRFIYAQIKDSCAMMGQEIMEMDGPY